MAIGFDSHRWEKLKHDTDIWWKGELQRPLVQYAVRGRDPGRPEPSLPLHQFIPFYDCSVNPREIIDRWDYELSCYEYLGDAFPMFFPNFGPGIVAGFLGADVQPGDDTVWFHPVQDAEIGEIQFAPDQENHWLRRVKDVLSAASDRWAGEVLISHADLGGALDIISTFRPGEKLLFDLLDYPEETKRLTWEVHSRLWHYFDQLDSLTRPANPGHSFWMPVFSSETSYNLQCDFSAMISPDMFEEFVLPELIASCKKLVNPFYHLDGPGELPHLDYLLSIPELKGIQWVPTAGAQDIPNWLELYRKIHDAGKLIHIWGPPDVIDAVVDQLGTGQGIVFSGWAATKEEAINSLRRRGVR